MGFDMLNSSSWTAVVRGALMKGLASTVESFASVSVSGRSARRHYGIEVETPFDVLKHSSSRRLPPCRQPNVR